MNETPIAKVSGSALLDEIKKQNNLLNKQIDILTTQNNLLTQILVSLKTGASTTPVTPQRQPVPQVPQQTQTMYPSMTTNPSAAPRVFKGERISGVDEPAWMNEPTPIKNI